ncbi:hypothetical protein LY28_00253 [Ruminiclostridium sufflavum DSM 19573]|uniref:Uncharacterized protein n=1 Tax=Ruminiclostridium sufflavum DSM 19573 TaxID=1121337 RepID=A0A318XUM0_9FIRM|nr:hypothetical protein [Ruminiclostridium sufflavum]PYG90370.1 hypothetical protein LY28_00253 [Ruminiclostridium sufflavum DSM 19573]
MTDFDLKLNAWLQVNHPGSNILLATPEVCDVNKLMSNGSNIAPSQAALTGSGASGALSNTDWASNPALGAANLANMARVSAGYNPTDLDNAGSTTTQYQAFVQKLVNCPLFIIKLSDHQSITKTSSDWNTMIDSIADTFEGIADKDKNSIVTGLKNLAQAASSKMSTEETESVFVQNVINVDNVVSYYLYSSKTSFIEQKGKGYDTKQSSFDILKLRLEFQSDLWPMYWQKVKAAFDGSIDDWLNDNKTSTAGTQPIPALQ